MARLKAPPQLPELVKKAFADARRDGDLHYFPTQVTILTVNSVPFQLRFSPALANKPQGPPKDPSKPHKIFDPFDNPPPPLGLASLGPSHILVLNKFAIVPEHFILATRDWKDQTHVLEASDLEATQACIAAYHEARSDPQLGHDGRDQQGLFAFFNSGEHSGASQPHRHIQLLPIARMRDGLDPDSPWSTLIDRPDVHGAPFAAFTEPISMGMAAAELHDVYLRLYRRACRAVALHTGAPGADSDAPADGEAQISYNMAMSESTLAILPRLSEGTAISGPDGRVIGSLALNGTVLAGTALAKNELEFELLKNDPSKFISVLRGIGIPSDDIDPVKL